MVPSAQPQRRTHVPSQHTPPQLGQPLSAKDYLEQCLAPAPGFSSDVTSRNRTRRVLTAYFKDRDCVTLVRPLEDEAKLQLVGGERAGDITLNLPGWHRLLQRSTHDTALTAPLRGSLSVALYPPPLASRAPHTLQMDTLPDKELRPQFRREMRALRAHVFTDVSVVSSSA